MKAALIPLVLLILQATCAALLVGLAVWATMEYRRDKKGRKP